MTTPNDSEMLTYIIDKLSSTYIYIFNRGTVCIKSREDIIKLMEGTNRMTIVDFYLNKECPDCGEPIPDDMVDGGSCEICGHVFCYPREDDD